MPALGDADWTQSHCRFYSDASIALASIDANINVSINSKFRIRLSVDNFTNTNTYRYLLEFKRNSGAWLPVDVGSEQSAYIVLSTSVADATATAQVLQSTAFIAGEFITTTRSSKSITLSFSSTELEYCIFVPRNSLLVGDTVQFRLVGVTTAWNGGLSYSPIALTNYPTTLPQITITKEIIMPERASLIESLQFGVETTPGTAVNATKKPFGLTIAIDPKTDIKMYRPEGSNKFDVGAARGKEITNITGQSAIFAANDMIYALASAFGAQSAAPVSSPNNNGTFLLTFSVTPTGSFTLTYNGITSTAITYSGVPSAMISAITGVLNAMSSIGTGTFIVKNVTGIIYSITFYAPYSTSSNLITANTGSLTGGTLVVTQSAPTNARRWTFTPSQNSSDFFQTLTIEKGQQGVSNFGMQIPFSFFTDMSFKISPSELSYSIKGFGTKMVDAFTMTVLGSGAEIPLGIIDPATIGVFYGTSLASMSRLSRNFLVDYSSSNRLKPIITLDDTINGISAIAEDTAYKTACDLTVEHDAQGQNFYSLVSTKQTVFIIIEAFGGPIDVGTTNNPQTVYNYRFKMTIPLIVMDPNKASLDGVEVFAMKATPVYSSVIGSGVSIIIDNMLTAY